ncbi:MAG: hypothetical protein FWC82_01295 [Firmicutes bacterium]|nr:hypothetical protein [Bacillota bacterium]
MKEKRQCQNCKTILRLISSINESEVVCPKCGCLIEGICDEKKDREKSCKKPWWVMLIDASVWVGATVILIYHIIALEAAVALWHATRVLLVGEELVAARAIISAATFWFVANIIFVSAITAAVTVVLNNIKFSPKKAVLTYRKKITYSDKKVPDEFDDGFD